MLDLAIIFTKGGFILWMQKDNPNLDHLNVINYFISNYLIQNILFEKNSIIYSGMEIHFHIHENLYFVAINQLFFPPKFNIQNFLIEIKNRFLEFYSNDDSYLHSFPSLSIDQLKSIQNFTISFREILFQFEEKETKIKLQSKEKTIEKLEKKQRATMEGSSSNQSKTKKSNDSIPSTKNPIHKEVLDFSVNHSPSSPSPSTSSSLSFDSNSSSNLSNTKNSSISIQSKIKDQNYEKKSLSPLIPSSVTNSSSNKFMEFFQGIMGQKELDKSTLSPSLDKIRQHLMEKNVSIKVIDTITLTIENGLIGKKPGTIQSIASLVTGYTSKIIHQILDNSRNFNLVEEIENHLSFNSNSSFNSNLSSNSSFNSNLSSNSSFNSTLNSNDINRPFIIVFTGVNGVGKSTSLAKMAHLILNSISNAKLMIAACDTFRSGAVEQLSIHVERLNMKFPPHDRIILFQRGYNSDASMVAKYALEECRKINYNVLLIDTAGRMQNNLPLLQSLAKLVDTVIPDRILFVGEATVGNESMDQLHGFQNALRDYCSSLSSHSHSHSSISSPYSFSNHSFKKNINGIVLSKWDAVQGKVGAILSLADNGKIPILFIGTGQDYGDLKTVNVDLVTSLLLS